MKMRSLVLAFVLLWATLPSAQAGDITRTFPHPSLTALDVVTIVMNALQRNDHRGADSGIAITFNFASPANKRVTGPLARFIPMVKGPVYGQMINHKGASYEKIKVEGDRARVDVIVRTRSGRFQGFRFELSRQRGNAYEGSWMTDSVVPIEVTAT